MSSTLAWNKRSTMIIVNIIPMIAAATINSISPAVLVLQQGLRIPLWGLRGCELSIGIEDNLLQPFDPDKANYIHSVRIV